MILLITQYCPSSPHKYTFKHSEAFSRRLLNLRPSSLYKGVNAISNEHALSATKSSFAWVKLHSLPMYPFPIPFQRYFTVHCKTIKYFSSGILLNAELEHLSYVPRRPGIATNKKYFKVRLLPPEKGQCES